MSERLFYGLTILHFLTSQESLEEARVPDDKNPPKWQGQKPVPKQVKPFLGRKRMEVAGGLVIALPHPILFNRRKIKAWKANLPDEGDHASRRDPLVPTPTTTEGCAEFEEMGIILHTAHKHVAGMMQHERNDFFHHLRQREKPNQIWRKGPQDEPPTFCKASELPFWQFCPATSSPGCGMPVSV